MNPFNMREKLNDALCLCPIIIIYVAFRDYVNLATQFF